MGLWLKQNTAVDFLAGPFVDDGDGKTPETGLTITQAEVRLSKNGGNMAQKNEATALSHDELGMYVCKLDATDTNTLGTLQVTIYEAGALMVYHEFMVVPANTYDSLVSGSDVLTADVTQIGGVAQSATDLKDFADTGYNPATHKVAGVVLTDTCTTNTDMVDVSDLATILADTNELQTDWKNGGRLDLLIDAIKAKTDLLLLADIAAAVWDESSAAHSDADTYGLYLHELMKIGKNKWAIVANQFIIYDDDAVTPLFTFNLDAAASPTTRTPA